VARKSCCILKFPLAFCQYASAIFKPHKISKYFEHFVITRFTARITELIHVLDDLNKGKYERTMVTDRNNTSNYSKICYYM